MKKFFKLLIFILILSSIIACGKKKEYKNEKIGVTDTNYYELVASENLTEIMHDGKKSSFKKEDVSNVLQCLKTTYDGVAFGDIVKFIDTQAGAHLVRLAYYHEDDTGMCEIWWVGNGLPYFSNSTCLSSDSSYISFYIPFAINNKEGILPLEFSEKIKDFLNNLPTIIEKKYPEKLPKDKIEKLIKEMEKKYVEERYIPYITINREFFSINQFKNFMENPEIFKSKYGVYGISSPLDNKPTDSNIIKKADKLLLDGREYKGNLYNGNFKRDVENCNTPDEEKLMFSHFKKLIEGNEIFQFTHMSTDLFSLTKDIEKKLNANIKSQYLKSDADNVYYIAEFYSKDKNDVVAVFVCVLYIYNTNQGQVVAPDYIELDFSNGNVLTDLEIGKFVDESWLK